MMFLDDMVVNIPILEGKESSMYCACPTMESIINSDILLYGTECTVDLVLSLSVLIFCSDVGLCSPADCVCSVDVTRSASILLDSLSAWYSFTWKTLLVYRATMACGLFRISFLPRPRHRLISLYFTFSVIVVKYGFPLMKQKSIWSGSSGWWFRIYALIGMHYLNPIFLGFFLTISPFKIAVAGP